MLANIQANKGKKAAIPATQVAGRVWPLAVA